MPQTWLDNTGLYQKYGVDQTVTAAGGEYSNSGDLREIQFHLALTALTATPTIITGADNIFIPAGVRIEEVQVVNEVAAATGVTIDLGLVRTDRTTEIDYNGILAAAPIADYNALGERITYTIPSAICGALMTTGTTGANPGYLTANSTATLFTTGIIEVRIRYRRV